MGEMRNAYSILVGKPEGERLLGRHRRSWEHNIRMHLRDVGWEVADWIMWLRTGTSGGIL